MGLSWAEERARSLFGLVLDSYVLQVLFTHFFVDAGLTVGVFGVLGTLWNTLRDFRNSLRI